MTNSQFYNAKHGVTFISRAFSKAWFYALLEFGVTILVKFIVSIFVSGRIGHQNAMFIAIPFNGGAPKTIILVEETKHQMSMWRECSATIAKLAYGWTNFQKLTFSNVCRNRVLKHFFQLTACVKVTSSNFGHKLALTYLFLVKDSEQKRSPGANLYAIVGLFIQISFITIVQSCEFNGGNQIRGIVRVTSHDFWHNSAQR